MNLSKKVFALVLILAISLTIFFVCAYLNVGGLGSALAGVGGPISAGLYNIAVAPLNWALTGGWAVAIFYVGVLIFGLAVAAFFWQYDIPYKILGNPNSSPTTAFQQNTSQTIPVTGLQSTTTSTPTENPFKAPEKKAE